MLIDDVGDLSLSKELVIARLKEKLYTHITETSNFPVWKQINYLNGQAQGREIQKARDADNWMQQNKQHLDVIEGQINAADDKDQIKKFLDLVSFTPPPFEL